MAVGAEGSYSGTPLQRTIGHHRTISPIRGIGTSPVDETFHEEKRADWQLAVDVGHEAFLDEHGRRMMPQVAHAVDRRTIRHLAEPRPAVIARCHVDIGLAVRLQDIRQAALVGRPRLLLGEIDGLRRAARTARIARGSSRRRTRATRISRGARVGGGTRKRGGTRIGGRDLPGLRRERFADGIAALVGARREPQHIAEQGRWCGDRAQNGALEKRWAK